MRTYIKGFVVAALALTVASCDDFLDKQPLDQRVESNFYKTEKDATEALVAIYDVLQWHTVQGYHPTDMLMDIASDDAFAGGGSSTDAPNIIEIDKSAVRTNNSEIQGLWRKYYIGIFRANIFLEKIEGIEASEEFKTRSIAEAKFLRAYFYLDLVRLFENVPLVLKTLAPTEVVPQAPVAEVYNQIALDLSDAIADLPAQRLKDGRVSKWAAEALLVRAYLFYNGVYGANLQAGAQAIDRVKATELIEDVINNSGHSLLDNYSDNFTKANEFSEESVFEISFSDLRIWYDWGFIQGGEGNIGIQMRGPRVDSPGDELYERGWSFSTVSQSLIDAFEATDPRKEATLLNVADLVDTYTVGYQHTGYFNKKYTTTKEYKGQGQPEHNWGNNSRVIRYSDVLLMAAELHALGGNIGAAQPYLDEVRDRVDLTPVTASLDNIYQERRVELALEGHRFWDLLRRGISVATDEISTDGTVFPTYIGDAVDFTISFNTARKGFLPIPQNEIDVVDGALDQNIGY